MVSKGDLESFRKKLSAEEEAARLYTCPDLGEVPDDFFENSSPGLRKSQDSIWITKSRLDKPG